MKKEIEKIVQDLKNQVLEKLMEKDLTDEVIYIRDELSDLTGGCIDHEIGGMCTKLTITQHTGDTIKLEDDFEEDLGEFELKYFSLEILLTLL